MSENALSITSLLKKTTFYSVIIFFTLCSWVAKAETQIKSGYYHNAKVAIAEGDIDQASLDLKLALQANPLDPKAHYMLGSLMASQGADDQAIIGFQRAIRINPTNPKALHNLGTLLLRRGQVVPAAELLEAAVTQDPDYIPPYNSLAKAYFLSGLPELAIATYEEVLHRDAENTIASKNRALLLAAANLNPDEVDKGRKKDTPGKDSPDIGPPGGNDTKIADAANPPPSGINVTPATLRKLLGDRLPYLSVEEYAGMLALTGWTRGARDRTMLDRILNKWPNVLDLTGTDAGDPQRMIELDVVLFIVTGIDTESIGFNFLRLIDLSYTYFASNNLAGTDWTGLDAPGTIPPVFNLPTSGSLFVASVDYDVTIANAVDEKVAVLARPHLTTLSGTVATFLAGGEFVFKVSGLESGDIKLYPFGTSVDVTPTLLRTPGETGGPLVHLNIKAERTSILELLTAQSSGDSFVFDKLNVTSQAIVGLDQSLILSGLNQRESRSSNSGVPILKDIPVIKYLFSRKTIVETTTSIIILLTPRDPAFTGKRNREALLDFVQMRRAFVKAKKGTEKDMLQFQKDYPKWQSIAPNRYASHFFLLENSELYRKVSGDDMIDEPLDLPLLNKNEEEE